MGNAGIRSGASSAGIQPRASMRISDITELEFVRGVQHLVSQNEISIPGLRQARLHEIVIYNFSLPMDSYGANSPRELPLQLG